MIETLIEHQQRTSMSVLEACQSTGLKKTVCVWKKRSKTGMEFDCVFKA